MKVLDLFCGKGGWSIPFIEDGAHVVGIDIKDLHYSGHLILEDIRNIQGHNFYGYDLIIGSPPCNHFSIAKAKFAGRDGPPDPDGKGLELVREFQRIIVQAQPRYWVMENVQRAERWITPVIGLPIWRFYMSVGGKRTLWGNLRIPPLTPEFRFSNTCMTSTKAWRYRGYKHRLRGADRAFIPYPIARFIADCVKQQIQVTV